jgi:AcrR family transcriptional regulator
MGKGPKKAVRRRRGRPPLSTSEIQQARARILGAAEKLFAESGYGGVSMRSVATAARCSPGALYTLFPNKRALLRAIGEVAFDAQDQYLARAARGAGDPIGRLKRLAVGYVNFWRRNPDHFRTLFLIEDRVVEPGEQYFVDTSRSLARMVGRFVEATDTAVATGELAGSPRVMVELIFCALHGVASGLIAMPEYRWCEGDRMAGRMMDALLAGWSKG